ncbi:putative ubiquitin carboxyl-terminal hydrolase [Triangularia verruculosa]|uniref:Ubiquitin carboxyl-terminal hydrolase n=1 Tax=Triangularia verruculosa TaxID=2587418 RepID=A0AAN6X6Z5_9PEZI|nr:putative ubiquitin carboxyl-terminal hydrolase [Triangularia verruculosa]
MACPHVSSANLSKPTPSDSVYREDCTQCFDSIDDPAGLDVCLKCFNGGCVGDRQHAKLHSTSRGHPLVLNIRRTRKIIERDEPPLKMSKLAIAAETEADRYEINTTVKCLECGIGDLDKEDPAVAPIVDSVMKANTFSRKEEVKAWEQEMTSCEHILTLQQDPPKQIESQDLGHCSKCDLKENLWLCLQCGALGCGRAQFGGVGGNSHALAHSQETGHGVAVKLGSITPEGTADVYCYTCDEERVDDSLGAHLANWGIILSERQKTEKSLTEMQIEQNLRWEFSMTTEDGKELTPQFGPGLTGLKNLGNSCYLASIVQCLFDIPAFQQRYGVGVEALPDVLDPAQDLETQLRKIADGLLSGRYSKPDSDVTVSEHSPEVPHQKGLQPSMLKHLIGRGHAEFSTMRQQDAFELLQHLVKLITRSKHPSGLPDPTQSMRFVLEQRLQCLNCKKVRYSSNEQDSIFIDVPLEKLPAEDGEEPKYKPVTLKECLDNLTATEIVELTCAACSSKGGFTKRTLFKTFPNVLVINARKMAVVNWVPVKVDVPVIVDDASFALDSYLSKGQQPDEESLPEDEGAGASNVPAFVPNAEALAMLEGMGFPTVRCEKALHATGNADANSAMEWLFAHMDDPDIDVPVSLGGDSGSAGAADPEKLAMLESMGLSGPRAVKALRETNGDVERAIEWLFSHQDDDGAVEEEETAAPAGDNKEAGSSELPANFQLQSIVCHKGTSIHAGHYVAFIRKKFGDETSWVLFNDEKVVKVEDVEEMKKFAYVYFFKRV